jgi:hypothetical protein
MMYPQLSGEPNFVLIGVSAVFGLLIIIIVYYIVAAKNVNATYKSKVSSQSLKKQMNSVDTPTPNDSSNNGYYAPANNPSIRLSVNGTTDATSATVSNPSIKQVFNVKENIYTLDDAPAVCGALGSEIASINQLMDAHKNGADWCNVGWTKDGLAAYPIQYSTWKTLQDNQPDKRNICGRPGINLSRNDPNLLYGVNCYGIKPEPKGNEKVKQSILSDKQRDLEAKIAQFQKNVNAIGVAPFNVNKWSL